MLVDTLILGVTGNIASGKSTIVGAFAKLGAAVLDADQVARDVVAPGSPVLQQLLERFGADILLEDGQLDREALGGIVFADQVARQDLNGIMHPAIGQLAVERLQKLKKMPGLPLIVYEAPLLFEAGAEGRVDQVLVVKIEPQLQLQRLMQRDHLDEVAALQRIAVQMSQEEKLSRADYVIDNSGTVEEVLRQVEDLWRELVPD